MARQILWFSEDEEQPKNSQIEFFSIAQDLKMEKKPIKIRYRNLIKDFQIFVRTKKSNLKSNDITILDQFLIAKFNNLINNVEDQLKDNGRLSMLLGIVQPDFRQAADKFSIEYRRLLKARDTLHYIPKTNQDLVDSAYKLMIAELRKIVFAPVMNLFSWDPAALPETGYDLDDKTKEVLKSDKVSSLQDLYNDIVGFLRTENINAKMDLDKDELIIKANEMQS